MNNNAGTPAVTDAAMHIRLRELRQNRIARILLLVFGAIMVTAGFFGIPGSELTAGRLWALGLSGGFYILSFSTLLCGVWTIGMAPQAGIGAYFFTLAALWPMVTAEKPVWCEALIICAVAIPGLLILFFAAVCAVMLVASLAPLHKGVHTLLVLGCKLKDGKRPGRMLRRRLNTAVRLLEREPDLSCIVTGGRAPGAELSEAEAMADYMLSRGVAPERIIRESYSSTTQENFTFSVRLLRECGLPERVGVVSDRFHQFRAGRIARTAGIDSFPLCCRTAWYLTIQFWMREVMCIFERIVKGHW